MSDGPPPKKQDAGTPAWVMTFADLMSLLMCFFVLLFSFSEMDANKYKQVAGSMKEAFGVQRDIKVKESPRGLRVIANEFSPGRPEPTPLNEVRQKTTNELKRFLDMGLNESRRDKVGALGSQNRENNQRRRYEDEVDPTRSAKAENAARSKTESDQSGGRVDADQRGGATDDELDQLNDLQRSQFEMISKALQQEILDGKVDVDLKDKNVVVRIREKASFPSGDADLRRDFHPIVDRLAAVLEETQGNIMVGGHTDDVPIHNTRFRSNWDLSAARAASLVHALLRASRMPAPRFHIAGYADTQPVSPTTSWESRALNRRVEVVLEQADIKDGGQIGINDPGIRAGSDTGMEAAPAGRQRGL